MSKYTTELRYICEVNASETESTGYNDVQEVIDNSWDKIFSFDFPIFDENYREGLCKKIIKHYYTREIAEETYGLWKLRLDARMNEIMPYFNKLYESELISIQPLINYRVNKSGNGSKGGSDGIVDSGSESVMGTDGNTKVKTGNETLGMAGKETNTRNGKDELTKIGKEIDTKDGTKTIAKIGNIEDTTEYDGDKTNTRKVLDGTLDTTIVDLFTDTPQGNIANMGTGYGSGSSTSDVPIVGGDTAWLTSANKTTTSENDTREIEDKLKYSNDYKETKKRTYNGEDAQSNFRDEETYTDYSNTKEFDNRKDTREYTNLKDEKSFENRVDTKTYNNVTITDNGNMSRNTIKGNNRTTTYGSTNAYMEAVTGSRGKSDAELLMEFRKSFLNIDEMVIKQLSDLFIYLW